MKLFGYSNSAETIRRLQKRVRDLENLCEEKDSFFIQLMADGLRHGSSLAARHMADRKTHLRNK